MIFTIISNHLEIHIKIRDPIETCDVLKVPKRWNALTTKFFVVLNLLFPIEQLVETITVASRQNNHKMDTKKLDFPIPFFTPNFNKLRSKRILQDCYTRNPNLLVK